MDLRVNYLAFLLQWCVISNSEHVNKSKVLTVLKSVKLLHPQQAMQLIWTTSPKTAWADLHDAVWISKTWTRSTRNIHFIRVGESFDKIILQLSSNVINVMVNPIYPVVKHRLIDAIVVVNNLLFQLVPFICKSRKILYLADGSSSKWLGHCGIPIDCEVYTVLSRNTLFEAYNLTSNLSTNRELSMKNLPGLFRRRSNLTGLKFKVATLHKYKSLEQSEDSDEKFLQTYYLRLFDILQELSNFTSVLFDSSETKNVGKKLENGNWTGLIGILQRNEVDIALAYFGISADVLKVFDITTSIMNDVFKLYIKTPPRDYSWRSFIAPLRFGSWIAVLAVFLLLPIGHFVLLRLSIAFGRKEQKSSLSDSYMIVMRGICSQGSGIAAYSWTKRILDLTVLSWGCVTMSLYSKTLYSHFATIHTDLPYNSLTDILNTESHGHEVMTYKNGILYTMAKTSTNDEMKILWEKHWKIPENSYNDLGRALQTICNKNKIIFTPKKISEPFMNLTNCSISAIPEKYFPFIAGFGLPKNSPYTSIINHCIFHLKESGILSYLEKKYMVMHIVTEDDATLQIDLNHTFPILCCFFILILFSCIILQIEILFHKIITLK